MHVHEHTSMPWEKSCYRRYYEPGQEDAYNTDRCILVQGIIHTMQTHTQTYKHTLFYVQNTALVGKYELESNINNFKIYRRYFRSRLRIISAIALLIKISYRLEEDVEERRFIRDIRH